MPNNSELEEKRWACVADGKVEMVIIWDGVQEWPPADDYEMIELAEESPVGPGWDYVGGAFDDNRPVEEDLEG
jgi:hypothetical protein